MRLACAIALILSGPAVADTVVATRTIRPQEILSPQDLRVDPAIVPGAFESIDEVVGQEALYAIYPGRAVMRSAVGEPALIERNQVVELIYNAGGLRIVAEGRALARGAEGERIRVMNLSSKTTLFGTISSTGAVIVSK
ncbi:flagellar basal body P-ring formation chaperone FlgA [Tropicibacter naphthalenivorans]|uniref:Flagella basal body P-ring formation protein FlgA n=1 Tax=Tropicibacter naphthalenivorans TaxID=441103 RepID=A0A0P1GVP0_9RHOB|nr:flagellar basal body P-ring formation chaperone FlgA [Tropicibacter naphthalenivorans]CUH79711.1 flagellar basal body P-ring biosynthesis protein FlgA [Tropicibacter naphthalenivorans]SMC74618.1 flagella basal body P-ring formation protein FlgA [Tropicibacter naphthalenivorans]